MHGRADGRDAIVQETERLRLRPWHVDEAHIRHELWTERDPRVPPHRRLSADGHPTVADLKASLRTEGARGIRLAAMERKDTGEVIGYCGLVGDDDDARQAEDAAQEAELAFELLRRSWGQGYATEAAEAVLEWARTAGYVQLRASVWDWNVASRRVLAKLGFVETGRQETPWGTTVLTARRL